MKVKKTNRSWYVGKKENIKIYEKAKIELNQNEQISFIDKNGSDIYEICKKIWGFYLSPSINKRLKNYNHKIYLTKDKFNKVFIMAVSLNQIKKFKFYCKSENLSYKILKY
jgi:hypothetical protein